MTDLNKQELRRLAHEASESGVEWLDSDEWRAVMADDWADYVAAAEPGVVIALLDENELLRQGVKGDFDLDAWLDWAKEAAKLRAVMTITPDQSKTIAKRGRDAIVAATQGAEFATLPAMYDQLMAECNELRQDAERYRALREMNWCDGPLAVVADPYSRIKLGSDCPSHERLDEAVDSIMAKAASADAGVVDYD